MEELPAPDRDPSSFAGSMAFWLAALAVLVAARVPYLTSPLYILDNDEAVLGIMARRMAAGQEWPMLFVGQNYGLAVFETLPAALASYPTASAASPATGWENGISDSTIRPSWSSGSWASIWRG